MKLIIIIAAISLIVVALAPIIPMLIPQVNGPEELVEEVVEPEEDIEIDLEIVADDLSGEEEAVNGEAMEGEEEAVVE